MANSPYLALPVDFCNFVQSSAAADVDSNPTQCIMYERETGLAGVAYERCATSRDTRCEQLQISIQLFVGTFQRISEHGWRGRYSLPSVSTSR